MPSKTIEVKDDNLSSPMLVGSSIQSAKKVDLQKSKEEIIDNNKDKISNSVNKILVSSYVRNVESLDRKNPKKTTSNYNPKSKISSTRQENVTKTNTYYNVTPKKYIEKQPQENRKDNKPDLLQYLDKREYVNLSSVFNDNKVSSKNISNKTSSDEIKKLSTTENRSESPVYENIDEINTKNMSTDMILQELTKAADQILQAVNGYTDDDSKLSSEDENNAKNKFRRNSDTLETISETKSWKKTQTDLKKQQEIKNKNKLYKPTSSTSSLESVTKENKYPVRPNRSEKLREERAKKKLVGNSSEASKVTKARRLQRASSREALLQSHGSSSEDLQQNVEVVRKPRLVRRTKTQSNSTASETAKKTSVSQTSYPRRRESDVKKNSER